MAMGSIGSDLNIGHTADYQNADSFRENRVGEEFGPNRIFPKQTHVLRLQKPETGADYKWQPAKKRGRETLLRRVGLHLCRHVKALADERREIFQYCHHVR